MGYEQFTKQKYASGSKHNIRTGNNYQKVAKQTAEVGRNRRKKGDKTCRTTSLLTSRSSTFSRLVAESNHETSMSIRRRESDVEEHTAYVPIILRGRLGGRPSRLVRISRRCCGRKKRVSCNFILGMILVKFVPTWIWRLRTEYPGAGEFLQARIEPRAATCKGDDAKEV